MTGQPILPGWLVFNVTEQHITEPTGALMPANIVPVNGPFNVVATFTGSGFIWKWLEGLGNVEYVAYFYAEGIGLDVDDLDLGTVSGTLIPGPGTYQVTHNVAAGINKVGYYEIACRVSFPQCRGMSGHCDHPLSLTVAP